MYSAAKIYGHAPARSLNVDIILRFGIVILVSPSSTQRHGRNGNGKKKKCRIIAHGSRAVAGRPNDPLMGTPSHVTYAKLHLQRRNSNTKSSKLQDKLPQKGG